MNERLLQFIWQHLYFQKDHLSTYDGLPVHIIFQGSLNHHQGPDFLHARLQINEITWAGNIELHLKTSDWNKHGHSNDEHYNNTILHVVWEHDVREPQQIPLLELKNRVSVALLHQYNMLMQQTTFIPCENQLNKAGELVWSSWKERMIAERLYEKNEKIHQLLKETNGHWEETFWQLLARNFGVTVNADAFESMAKTITVAQLAKNKHQIHQLEALLLGQAGLLNENFTEDYPILLQKEYQYLQKKYKLQPSRQLLSFLRMRPSNFPSVRLAQLAMLIHHSSHLFSKIIEASNIQTIKQLLSVTANDYWHYHYQLNQPSAYRKKQLGHVMIENILINTIIPILFAYALQHNNEELKQKALDWLQLLPVENNTITKKWEATGVQHKTAYDSQALLYLKKNYCNHKHCLQCAIGNSILKQGATS
ncbi:MAG: DUF2851 family protein [Chitinophagaceae bacterium]|jgi:hypothetical protein|nr:DUF2851 family protein [Chitinophagaceae bacterium]